MHKRPRLRHEFGSLATDVGQQRAGKSDQFGGVSIDRIVLMQMPA